MKLGIAGVNTSSLMRAVAPGVNGGSHLTRRFATCSACAAPAICTSIVEFEQVFAL